MPPPSLKNASASIGALASALTIDGVGTAAVVAGAVVVIALSLIGVVIWFARRPDIEEVVTPILTFRRRSTATENQRPPRSWASRRGRSKGA